MSAEVKGAIIGLVGMIIAAIIGGGFLVWQHSIDNNSEMAFFNATGTAAAITNTHVASLWTDTPTPLPSNTTLPTIPPTTTKTATATETSTLTPVPVINTPTEPPPTLTTIPTSTNIPPTPANEPLPTTTPETREGPYEGTKPTIYPPALIPDWGNPNVEQLRIPIPEGYDAIWLSMDPAIINGRQIGTRVAVVSRVDLVIENLAFNNEENHYNIWGWAVAGLTDDGVFAAFSTDNTPIQFAIDVNGTFHEYHVE